MEGRPLKFTSREALSPRPPAREPAPSRDHERGVEKGTQEKASSAITSPLETSGPSILSAFPRHSQARHALLGPLSHMEDKPCMVAGALGPHCSELHSWAGTGKSEQTTRSQPHLGAEVKILLDSRLRPRVTSYLLASKLVHDQATFPHMCAPRYTQLEADRNHVPWAWVWAER